MNQQDQKPGPSATKPTLAASGVMSDATNVSTHVARLSATPAAVATDCDGTLTTNGALTSSVLAAIGLLRQHSIPLVLVTGRAAGYAWTLFELVDAQAVIAENGGVLYERSHPEQPIWLNPVMQCSSDAQFKPGGWGRGHELFTELKQLQLVPADWPLTHDCSFRFTDLTFPLHFKNDALQPEQLNAIATHLSDKGAGFVYSTIHAHIMPTNQTKARMLAHWAERNGIKEREILTIGDSLNDESLFEKDKFGPSWGVANIRSYLQAMKHRPERITEHAQGLGFAEMVCSLAQREQPKDLLGKLMSLDLGYKAVIFIDGYCSLCHGFGSWINRVCSKGRVSTEGLRLATLQGRTAQKLLSEKLQQTKASQPSKAESLILWQAGSIYHGADAILRLFEMLGGGQRLAARFLGLLPHSLLGWGYAIVAGNRYRIFGRRAECSLTDQNVVKHEDASISERFLLD
jgi:hydroxymethylpyrimidine pyrophosphatase-like HAD family hydrolase/predicted DCC family thiol-disulfide oxidoreductase YuxK